MKLGAISPWVTSFKDGRCRKVGNWSYRDAIEHGYLIRNVYHYGTLMGKFVLPPSEWGTSSRAWLFQPVSVGWGSASDQQGMNKILVGAGWVYRRNAPLGARYEYHHVDGSVSSFVR